MSSTWKVAELKDELRKRGASLKGKKADLIESTQKLFDKAVQLYESHHILNARSCQDGDYTYLKGYCRKTMKNLQYEVNIKLDQYGDPIESHCECPAGSGTTSVYKHVAVILLGVEHMVRDKIMLCFEVCTQRLQQFHVPKKQYTGTPVRAVKLLRKHEKSKLIFEPYPVQSLDKQNYNSSPERLNYKHTNMPMKQLYEPSNPYATQNNHNYTGEDHETVELGKM